MPTGKGRLSVRMWWITWRARLSIPSLLATQEEWKVVSIISGVNGALAILTISLLAWVTGLPLVFPALGPSAFILFTKPFSPDAAPRSVILGHFIGIASGVAAWLVFSYLNHAPVSLDSLGWPALASASAALAATCILLVRFSCPHAPACASALVVALGGAPGWSSTLAMLCAVVVLVGQALLIYRIAGVRTPFWTPDDAGGHPHRQSRA
jgi:CBS-domain-containing membrane protein